MLSVTTEQAAILFSAQPLTLLREVDVDDTVDTTEGGKEVEDE
jgi:hypothetical protein